MRQARVMIARRHVVTVLLPDPNGSLGLQLQAIGAQVRRAPSRLAGRRLHLLVLDVMRLRRAIAEEQPDVLFYQLWASAFMARLASLRMRPVRRVHMVPGPAFLEASIVGLIERGMVRLDDLVIAGSQYTADMYVRLGVPSRRLAVVPYGADADYFRPATAVEREDARRRLGIPRDAFVAVMVAYVYGGKRLVLGGRAIKGHADLLAAWQLLTLKSRHKHLLLVGDGFDASGRAHRRVLFQTYNVEANPEVTWLPSVGDVRPYYAAADLSVSPSLSENHGAAVEASAMGVPSIVSDAGGLPEVAPVSGWVFPAGDRIELLARLSEAAELSRDELKSRGRDARRRVEDHFDAQACANHLVTLLEREGAAPMSEAASRNSHCRNHDQ